jgi:NadR type nicotinamide-nucleotide adenylyltransferase
MKQIVLTGAESTGKTTLSRALANHFNCPWVEEYARSFLNQTEGKYSLEDLDLIALKQYELIEAQRHMEGDFFICDTDILTIYIWSLYKYDKVSKLITELAQQQRGDLYLVCQADLPWERDPLREHPFERNDISNMYIKYLNKNKITHTEVNGLHFKRINTAISQIQSWLSAFST